MTRRTAIPVMMIMATAPPVSHRTMAESANSFHAFWAQWAEEVNKTPQGGISARAVSLAATMDEMYKNFRTQRKRWEQGL